MEKAEVNRAKHEELVAASAQPALIIAENIMSHAQGAIDPELQAGLATMIAERVLQNLLVSFMLYKYPPGDPRGEVEFKNFYAVFQKTTIDRWHGETLKKYYGSTDEGNPPGNKKN